MEKTVCIGRVCRSRSGRDRGKFFVIKQIVDANYVYITDGAVRKIGKPKLKKLKHLELKGEVIEGIAEKLCAGTKVFDAEIRSALNSLGYIE